MGFQAAFGATPTAPAAGAGGFSGAFGSGQTATPAPVNVALQRQTMPQPAKVASVSPWSVLTGIPAASGVIPALTTPLAPSSYNPAVAAKTNPLVVPETAWNTVKTAVTTAGNALADTYSSVPAAINGTGSKLQAATDVGTAGVDAISAIFSPISGALAGLAKMPVIGVAAGAVNNLFSALGAGGSAGATGLVDALPVSDATKAKILPLAQQAGALVAQIAGGKVGADSISLLKGNLSHIIDHVQADATAPVENPIPIKPGFTPPVEATPMAEPAAPTTPNVPQTTPESPQTTPESPQTTPNVPTPETPTTPVVPPTEVPSTESVPTAETPAEPTVPAETAPQVKVQKTGEITKAASDINSTLVKQGFDALPPEEQSHYTPESYKEIADNLTNGDSEDIKKMATGEMPVDRKLYGQGQVLFKTVSQLAANTGDDALLAKLAKSPLGKKLSLSAQTLGESGYVKSDGSIDTVGVLRDINDTRQAALKAKGTDVVKETAKDQGTFRKTIRATRAPKQSWEDFAKNILTCKS